MNNSLRHGRFRPGLLLLAASLLLAGPLCGQTNPVKLVKGVVSDRKTGTPADGGVVLAFIGSSSEAAARSRINPKTGAYQMILNPDTEYRIRIEALHYVAIDLPYRSPAGAVYEESSKNYLVDRIVIGTLLFHGPLFDGGSDRLRPNGTLDKAIAFLRENRAVTVEIAIPEERSSSRGKREKGSGTTTGARNAADPLTEARRTAINQLFEREKIDASRLVFRSGQAKGAAKRDVGITILGFVSGT